MQSSLNAKPTDDPHDFVVIPADAVRVAPSDNEISDLLRVAARQHSDAQVRDEPGQAIDPVVPPLDASFRPTTVNDDLATNRGRVMRAIMAVLIAACIGGAAMAWQASGYAAKKLFAKWIPQFALTSSLTLDKLGLTSPSAPPADEPAAADSAAQAAPAQAAAESPASNTAGRSSDATPSLQSMARDLANARQEVETLKASIAELKASQQQMARDLAKASEKASEQNAHAKPAPAPARAAVANARKPAPSYSSPYSPSPTASAPAYRLTPAYPTPQTAAAPPLPPATQPYPSRQVEPLPPPQGEQVPRPPMPVQ
jgi:hypothetical protein